jgi:hypothetical protein
MLPVTAKLETDVRAALIVRDDRGELLEPQPTAPIPVDAASVANEIRRLRSMFGMKVSIDPRMIFEARAQLARDYAALTA